MRKLLVPLTAGLLLLSSLVAGHSVAGPVTTATAPDCGTPAVITASTSPTTVTLGPGRTASLRQIVRVHGRCIGLVLGDELSPTFGHTFRMQSDDHEVPSLAASVSAAGSRSALPAGGSVWRHRSLITSTDLTNADAGTWHTRISGGGPERFVGAGADFQVLRSSRIRVHDHVRAAGSDRGVSIRGQLSRADWDHDRFTGFGAQTIEVQRKSARGDYRPQRVLHTNRHGRFRVNLGQIGGCFRLVFPGSATTAASNRSIGCLAAGSH